MLLATHDMERQAAVPSAAPVGVVRLGLADLGGSVSPADNLRLRGAFAPIGTTKPSMEGIARQAWVTTNGSARLLRRRST